jgi:hypothetical protein
MKKVTVIVLIFLVMITLGSVCGADDKSGYVIKESFTFNLPFQDPPGNEGRVYCKSGDFVTGCSHRLYSYSPTAPNPSLSSFAFLNVIPIECTPSLKETTSGAPVDGQAVCTGCLVHLNVTDPGAANISSVTFSAYAYCGKPSKK